jgi:hypothetical protein
MHPLSIRATCAWWCCWIVSGVAWLRDMKAALHGCGGAAGWTLHGSDNTTRWRRPCMVAAVSLGGGGVTLLVALHCGAWRQRCWVEVTLGWGAARLRICWFFLWNCKKKKICAHPPWPIWTAPWPTHSSPWRSYPRVSNTDWVRIFLFLIALIRTILHVLAFDSWSILIRGSEGFELNRPKLLHLQILR